MSQMNYGHNNGYCGRRNRTSRTVMFLRACIVTWFIAMFFGWLTNGIFHWIPSIGKVNVVYSDGVVSFDDQVWAFIKHSFISVPVAVSIFVLPAWLFTTIAANLFYGNNPVWVQWVQEGGSHFWDNLLWPINPDSDFVRRGGVDPLLPIPHGVYVDPNWQYQCQNCFNLIPYEGEGCNVCGAGYQPVQQANLDPSNVPLP